MLAALGVPVDLVTRLGADPWGSARTTDCAEPASAPATRARLCRSAFVRVVRADNQVKDLLYAGTETGLYLSYNGGKQWQPLQLNLPITPITDLKLHQDHLLASTQGRAFWVLDDLTPIRKNSVATTSTADLLPVKDVIRSGGYSPLNQSFPDDMPVTHIKTTMVNPASGAVIYFHLQNKDSVKNVTIDILDASKTVIRSFYKEKPKKNGSNNSLEADPKIVLREGLNKFVWDLQYPNLPTIDNVYVEGDFNGRMAVPGSYTVRLTVDGNSFTSDFKLLPDPTATATAAEYAAQDQLLKAISDDDVTDLNVSVVYMRKIKSQLEQFSARVEGNTSYDSLSSQAKTLVTSIKTWEEQLIQPKSQSNDDVINFENRLCSGFIFLKGNVDNTVPYVTAVAQSRFAELHKAWMALAEQKKQCLAALSQFNARCNTAGIRLIGLEGE